MKCAEIRQAFLDFFASKEHAIIESSTLVPGNDPTLLFTAAGMVQFKDVFLGTDPRDYQRASSSQRCVRAGGKHNDLENVGYTARHHTFFEMLGNFSFGDYFKREAIRYAWEFLTQVLALPPERLWVTVHVSDDEAADIWLKEMGISPERFSRLDEDNFWQMGDTGPCGPCTEIFYDHGEDVPGGPPGSENDDLDRYIEIWNLVFMQYERQSSGGLISLPKPSVDTGMGLERIAAVMQGVHSNYEIDLFQALLSSAATLTGTKNLQEKSLRVIADHIRSSAFLVSDGVLPSNEGRGYVLRRIIRRAIRHGHKLGQKGAFFGDLVPTLVDQMGDAYPALRENQSQIIRVLSSEESKFAKTLDKGMALLESQLAELGGSKIIPGEVVFLLHDTYGFPADLTQDIARERGLDIDQPGFDAAMEKQRQSGGDKFKVDYTAAMGIDQKTEFVGYDALAQAAVVTHLLKGDVEVTSLEAGEKALVVLSETPFYAESGGQVGDAGWIESTSGKFKVLDCQKKAAESGGDCFYHIGELVSGELEAGVEVQVTVDTTHRQNVALNHSATHLLHAALREELGEHVQQKGSLVDAEKLRFDFAHFEAVTHEQIQAITNRVNAQIRFNSAIDTHVCSMEDAKAMGAMALFGEKYGKDVRVLSMGEIAPEGRAFSMELCGGTHAKRTGDIGFFQVLSESGIAAGVRRIEAVTGANAADYIRTQNDTLRELSSLVKSAPEALVEKTQHLLGQQKILEKRLGALEGKLASLSVNEWLDDAKPCNGVSVLVKKVDGDAKSLRGLVDQLKNKLGSCVVLLATASGGKVALVAGVSKETTGKIKAGDIVRQAAQAVDGKGGGRPDMAQGGGVNIDALPEALLSVEASIIEKLA